MQFSFSIDFSRNSKITYIFPAETLQSYRIHNPFNVIYRLKICLDKWSPTLSVYKIEGSFGKSIEIYRKDEDNRMYGFRTALQEVIKLSLQFWYWHHIENIFNVFWWVLRFKKGMYLNMRFNNVGPAEKFMKCEK